MGRNKDLKRKVAGRLKVIEEHEEKIRRERMRPNPDEPLIEYWQRQIEARKKEAERLNRRLKRAW